MKVIKNWYNGKAEGRVKTPLGTGVSFRRKYHWSAKLARQIIGFCKQHWQWLIGFIVTLVALTISINKIT